MAEEINNNNNNHPSQNLTKFEELFKLESQKEKARQRAQAELCNIISRQGNATQNHNDTTSHPLGWLQ